MADEDPFNDIDLLDDFLEKAIVRKMGEERLQYRDAMAAVHRENPAIVRLREGLYRQREAGKSGQKFWRMVEGQLIEIDDQIENLAREAQKEHPELGYREALRLVASEHHELFILRESTWQVLLG
jgi:hypothetical protein